MAAALGNNRGPFLFGLGLPVSLSGGAVAGPPGRAARVRRFCSASGPVPPPVRGIGRGPSAVPATKPPVLQVIASDSVSLTAALAAGRPAPPRLMNAPARFAALRLSMRSLGMGAGLLIRCQGGCAVRN